MKTTFITGLFLIASLVSSAHSFGQTAFPANAVEASQLGTRTELSQEIAILRQQHAGLKAEVERYGQDSVRIKRELELVEKAQKDSAASVAALNVSIGMLSSQEKALASKISADNERDGNLTVRVRTLAQELDSLQTRIKQEKMAVETVAMANAKEVARLNQEFDTVKVAHAASVAELNKVQQEAQAKRTADDRALDAQIAIKKQEAAAFDAKLLLVREQQAKKADDDIGARKQTAIREAEDILNKSKTETAAMQVKTQAEREAILKVAEADIRTRVSKLENDEKAALKSRETATKAMDEEFSKRRAMVTKELDYLEAEVVQGKKETASQMAAMRDTMRKEAQAEANKIKEQDLSQGSAKLTALNKQLREVTAKIQEAEARVKVVESREQQAEAKLSRLAAQMQPLEVKQDKIQTLSQRAVAVIAPVSNSRNEVASSSKAGLDKDILQKRRQLESLNSDDLAKQIRRSMTPEDK